jgi:hypothetical protein
MMHYAHRPTIAWAFSLSICFEAAYSGRFLLLFFLCFRPVDGRISPNIWFTEKGESL